MERSRRSLSRLLPLAAFALSAAWPMVSHTQTGGTVHASPAEVQPLAPGTEIPSVQVETVRGEPIDLAERVREGGALLVFYRGGW